MDNKAVREQEPKVLWNHFADINAIPRASKKEERIVQFMVSFGEKLGLETIVDPIQNVIIKKPASPGMEDRKTVVLQSHLDMVHQKNSDIDFNFDTDGIQMYVDGDWVKANGTTLGADNGLGVAAIMSVLSSNDLSHPAIEALFTIDEETGMTGAFGLEAGYLEGEILLNLDTEEDDEIDIGCAGGVDVNSHKTYKEITVDASASGFKITVKGLQGGHSGMDIHKGLGNANKIMNEILSNLSVEFDLAEIDGGGLRNAIPRESFSIIACKGENAEQLRSDFESISAKISEAFKHIEPDLICELEETDLPANALPKEDKNHLLNAIDKAINGVYKMSKEIPDLVEASNNIARVIVSNGNIEIACLTRSSSEDSKKEVSDQLTAVFKDEGFTTELSGSYPGWQPNKESAILDVLTNIYVQMFKSEPDVVACHAGLECGILGTNYPDMDMISFGPTIKGAHSPDERASISSSKRFWAYLQEILKNIPLRNS